MSAPLPLEGDGIVDTLFHYLYTIDDLGEGPRVRIPPTVIYRGPQPLVWYFTSRKSGRIKRKHRVHLTAAHIEHSFTKRRAAADLVAYCLYLPTSERTNPAIEYFDTEALRDFLLKRAGETFCSGSLQSMSILQQFVQPKGARNSTLRAIWSPKVCLLERRENVHALHDARFSVYERGVTFEEGGGADALSRPDPVRGSILPGMVQQLCERIVDHVTRVSYHKFRIARMVLRLQVDTDDRIWFLWSSSLRLQPPLTSMTNTRVLDVERRIRPLDIVSDVKVPLFAFTQNANAGTTTSLRSNACSSLETDEDLWTGHTRCASCALVVAPHALLPTTYKAVLAHFQQIWKFLCEQSHKDTQGIVQWPPDDRLVQQAGGVGFGILRHVKSMSSSNNDNGILNASAALKPWQGRDFLIPPVIRYMHPSLKVEDFVRHRQDPIFLHKTVRVCEQCCLVYADYATVSLEANGLGFRSTASAPALLRPTREIPKQVEYFHDSDGISASLRLSPLARGALSTSGKMKPPASAWKPLPAERHLIQPVKNKTKPRSTLHAFPIVPKLPPRIDSIESDDNDALGLFDAIRQHEDPQQHRETAVFRGLYQYNDLAKRKGHTLQHVIDAADHLSKAKPQYRLAALGVSTQMGQSQSTGALMDAVTALKRAKKTSTNPYAIIQRIHSDDRVKRGAAKIQASSSAARKKSRRKKQGRDGDDAERGNAVNSREKRAAAEHRAFLGAALSDTRIQLEQINSLATLVIPAQDVEELVVSEAKEEGHCGNEGASEEELVHRSQNQEERLQEQRQEQEQQEQIEDEEEEQDEDNNAKNVQVKQEEDSVIQDEREDVRQETPPSPNVEDDQEMVLNVKRIEEQKQEQEQEQEEQEHSFDVNDQTQCELDNIDTFQQPLREEDKSLEGEVLRGHSLDEVQLQSQEPVIEANVEDQLFGEEEEEQLQVFESLMQGIALIQNDEDEYDDEYEDPDHEQDIPDRDKQEQHDHSEKEDSVEAEPAQALLNQVQELLATSAISDVHNEL